MAGVRGSVVFVLVVGYAQLRLPPRQHHPRHDEPRRVGADKLDPQARHTLCVDVRQASENLRAVVEQRRVDVHNRRGHESQDREHSCLFVLHIDTSSAAITFPCMANATSATIIIIICALAMATVQSPPCGQCDHADRAIDDGEGLEGDEVGRCLGVPRVASVNVPEQDESMWVIVIVLTSPCVVLKYRHACSRHCVIHIIGCKEST